MSATCFIIHRLPTAILWEAPAPTPPTLGHHEHTWPVSRWIFEIALLPLIWGSMDALLTTGQHGKPAVAARGDPQGSRRRHAEFPDQAGSRMPKKATSARTPAPSA